MRLLAVTACLFGLAFSSNAAARACPWKSPPSPIDAIGELREQTGNAIAFAARPSLQYPSRAWVVRLSRRGFGAGQLEIARLKEDSSCKRYAIEKQWRAELSKDDYEAAAREISAVGMPPADSFSHNDQWRALESVAIDGTGIELRLGAFGWDVKRKQSHHGKGGAEISAAFRKLVEKHVPAAELPTEDWRTRSD